MKKLFISIFTLFCILSIASRANNDLNQRLLQAANNGDSQLAKRLIEGGADVNTKNRRGKTALHFAATEGHFECLNSLMTNGANPNAQDDWLGTPLHAAVMNKRIACIGSLWSAGANFEIHDEAKTIPSRLIKSLRLEKLINKEFDVRRRLAFLSAYYEKFGKESLAHTLPLELFEKICLMIKSDN